MRHQESWRFHKLPAGCTDQKCPSGSWPVGVRPDPVESGPATTVDHHVTLNSKVRLAGFLLHPDRCDTLRLVFLAGR